MTTANREDHHMTGFPDSDTWGMKPRFKLRRIGQDGPLYLAIDPLDGGLPILDDGFVALELKDGVDRDAALALLDQLSDMVAHLTYTGSKPKGYRTPGRAERCRRISDLEASEVTHETTKVLFRGK
jgi:hypothetical protein